MKRLITDIYKILYKLTGAKHFSLITAIVYITLLNIITIKGLGMLLEGWMSSARFLQKLFVFPYIIITTIVLLVVNFLNMLPLKNLRKEKQKKPIILPIIIYTLIVILLVWYINYSNRLN